MSLQAWYHQRVFPHLLDRVMQVPGLTTLRQQLLAPLSGEVVEIGFGTGLNLAHYPPEVTGVVAIDPGTGVHRLAEPRMAAARIPVRFELLSAERLPLATGSVQTLVSSWTLCSIPDVQGALAEIRRVLDPVQGRFHFVEHGLAPEPRLARWQHRLTPVQRVVADGCHLDRDMPALLRGAGLVLEVCEQFWVPGLPRLGAYMTLGRARVG